VAETDEFESHTPTRLMDTRLLVKLPDHGVQKVHVADPGVDTVIGNLTVTGPNGQGYTTVYPCLDGRPNTSNNNFLGGQTIPDLVVAHPDSNGDICLYTTTSAHLIWDQVAETDAIHTHVAQRLIDTRLPAGRL
jgi:hypothetical protein